MTVGRAEAPSAERLYALAEAAAQFVAENREWIPLTLEVWTAGASRKSRQRFATALREMYVQHRKVIADIVRTGQTRGELRRDLDPDALGAALIGAMDGLLLQCWFDPALDSLQLLQGFVDPLMRGMRANNQGGNA